jgi:hypothetical protein
VRKILEHCPSCGEDLWVTRMSCPACGTEVTGHWLPCHFCSLSPEHTLLLEAFVRARGNLKEMARELETSYWTVRKQIDELVTALGYEPAPPPPEDTAEPQLEILDRLDRGEISPAEATALLAALKGDQ